MKKIIISSFAILLFAAPSSFAARAQDLKTIATKIVPQSKVVSQKDREMKVETPNGTILEVEFDRMGNLEEVSGDAAQKGDVLKPEGGLISLSDAVASLAKAQKQASGDWSLEKSMIHGWVYEFEGYENGQKMKYLVSAKNGSLLTSKQDD